MWRLVDTCNSWDITAPQEPERAALPERRAPAFEKFPLKRWAAWPSSPPAAKYQHHVAPIQAKRFLFFLTGWHSEDGSCIINPAPWEAQDPWWGIPFYQSLYPTCRWWCILLLSSTVLLCQKGTACPDGVNIQGLRPARCSMCRGGTATMSLNSHRNVTPPGNWHVHKSMCLRSLWRQSVWLGECAERNKTCTRNSICFQKDLQYYQGWPCRVSWCTFVHKSACFLIVLAEICSLFSVTII